MALPPRARRLPHADSRLPVLWHLALAALAVFGGGRGEAEPVGRNRRAAYCDGWVNKRFLIDGKPRGRRVLIPAKIADNPRLGVDAS